MPKILLTAALLLFMVGCREKMDTPILGIVEIIETRYDHATFQTEIQDDGGAKLTGSGYLLSLDPEPDKEDQEISVMDSSGFINALISGLEPGTTYYLRAWASNQERTGYSEVIKFSTWSDQVVDVDGNVYQTVRIGNQLWMKENLKAIHFPDGTPIPYVADYIEWNDLGASDPAYCWYENSDSLGLIYGGLYTWQAASYFQPGTYLTSTRIQGVCPDGWHLPTDMEWKELERYIGMEEYWLDQKGFRGDDEGSLLKATEGDTWRLTMDQPTDAYGFSALGSGGRNRNGSFVGFRIMASFWSSSTEDGYHAYCRDLWGNDGQIFRGASVKDFGSSVRCIKD